MTDRECIDFLQWALPKMRMRWPGFRKVRGQVNKRISRRIAALNLPDVSAYHDYVQFHPGEWKTLASICRVTISRFYRDRGVFDHIGEVVLPRLASKSDDEVRCWSAGCASGEEAYSIKIVWELRAASASAGKILRVSGTDTDPVMIERAHKAVYPASALKDLPADLAAHAFERSGGGFLLRAPFKENVRFEELDLRDSMPSGSFDVILCRNLAFTYFEETLQQEILRELTARLRAGGALVIGAHETLPTGEFDLRAEAPAVFEKIARMT